MIIHNNKLWQKRKEGQKEERKEEEKQKLQ